MAHRWAFQITDSPLLESLSWSLHGPDVSIIRVEEDAHPPQFLWASAHLDELEPGPLLFARATALKEIFDGTLYLLDPDYRPHRLEDLIDWQADRRVSAFEPAPSGSPFSSKLQQQPLSEDHWDRVQSKMLEGTIYVARTDPDVLSMLQILGKNGISFSSLYQIRDCLNYAGIDDKQIAILSSQSKKEVDRFRHTANNYTVLGPSGRHGRTNFQPPAVPMELEEAASIILPVAKKFITHRITGKPLVTQKAPVATPIPTAEDTPSPAREIRKESENRGLLARMLGWLRRALLLG